MKRLVVVVLAVLLLSAPAASAQQQQLPFTPCGQTPEAATTECATAKLPMVYGAPKQGSVNIAVARVPAVDKKHRIGALFFNFGGPGAPTVDYLQFVGASGLWSTLNKRFDIIGFDPRGVGQSTPSIDCQVDQEALGIYSVPFATPIGLNTDALLGKDMSYQRACLNRNGNILSHLSTANVARDMDQIRGLLGETKLNYLGFSYGTFLGATYATLFPDNYRAMVLDGPIDADGYINKPWSGLAEQTSGFERAFGRFFQACAADQTACSGFGGQDPWSAYDELIQKANAKPLPANGFPSDPRPVTGDEINFAAAGELYAKFLWPELGQALAQAAQGDGSFFRALVDDSYGRNDDGTYDPGNDGYFLIGATEQRYPRNNDFYFDRGDEAWGEFDHAYWNNGYVELNYGLWPARDRDTFGGPFYVPSSSPTPLVVATTYDPATPYRGALRLVNDLQNARLITMRGDGHTAYGGESPCIDQAVNRYLNAGTLPADGTTCQQDDPFVPPSQVAAQADTVGAVANQQRRVLTGRVPGGR
jgi:pimeloyl-ACP methyl ester carboxylesterase